MDECLLSALAPLTMLYTKQLLDLNLKGVLREATEVALICVKTKVDTRSVICQNSAEKGKTMSKP